MAPTGWTLRARQDAPPKDDTHAPGSALVFIFFWKKAHCRMTLCLAEGRAGPHSSPFGSGVHSDPRSAGMPGGMSHGHTGTDHLLVTP